jgi:hypothetical protein
VSMGPSLFMAFFLGIQGVGVRPCKELVASNTPDDGVYKLETCRVIKHCRV